MILIRKIAKVFSAVPSAMSIEGWAWNRKDSPEVLSTRNILTFFPAGHVTTASALNWRCVITLAFDILTLFQGFEYDPKCYYTFTVCYSRLRK